jgi:hypothetical protein
MASGFNFNPAQTSPFTEVQIGTATAGITQLVQGASGVQTRLYQMALTAAGTTTVTPLDGTTALTGPMTMIAGVPFILNFNGEPWFSASIGNTFSFSNSGAVQISGRFYFVQS